MLGFPGQDHELSVSPSLVDFFMGNLWVIFSESISAGAIWRCNSGTAKGHVVSWGERGCCSLNLPTRNTQAPASSQFQTHEEKYLSWKPERENILRQLWWVLHSGKTWNVKCHRTDPFMLRSCPETIDPGGCQLSSPCLMPTKTTARRLFFLSLSRRRFWETEWSY